MTQIDADGEREQQADLVVEAVDRRTGYLTLILGMKRVSRPTSQVVMQTLDSGIHSVRAATKAGAAHLIVLFYDINNTTAASISAYIDTITAAVKAAGRTPQFTASTKAVMDIFLATKT